MSSMLEQAIVDAEALKEAAIKNAENELIEKYSEDIKEAVENLLEQPPPGGPREEEMPPEMMAAMMGGGAPPGPPGAPPGMPPGPPMGPEGPVPGEAVEDELAPSWAEEGEELCPCPGDEDEVTLSLSGLAQLMGAGSEPEAEEMLSGEQAAGEIMGEPTDEEQFLVQESMLSDILGEDIDLSDESIYEDIELEEDDNPDVYEEKLNEAPPPDASPGALADFDYARDEWEGSRSAPTPEDEVAAINQFELAAAAAGDGNIAKGHAILSQRTQDAWDQSEEGTGRRPTYDFGGPATAYGQQIDKISGLSLPENTQKHIAQLEERLRAYDYYYTALYENHTKLNENHTKLNENHKNTINENKNKKETISDKAKKRFESLKKENKNHRQLVSKLKEKLDEVNLSNAKLLYTNRVLNSDSLNERQKDKIVKAVSKAGTVEEAKTIFETLQSAVKGASSSKKASKSLNEAVANNSSAFLPRREVKNSDPSLVDRMQKLAGITKI
jgi:hypothetical protein